MVSKKGRRLDPNMPAKMSVVRFSLEEWEKDKYGDQYPFKDDDHLLFLGEIEGMPGHCAVVNKRGRTFWGYHTENFVQLTEDEL